MAVLVHYFTVSEIVSKVFLTGNKKHVYQKFAITADPIRRCLEQPL